MSGIDQAPPPPRVPLGPLPVSPGPTMRMGMHADGASRAAWQPSVFSWIAAWRLLIVAELAIALIGGLAPASALAATVLAAGWTIISIAVATRPPRAARTRRAVLVVDLVGCLALLAAAPDQMSFALLALLSCSTVVAWASGRPVDAFVAAAITGGGYLALGLVGPWAPYADSQPAPFVANAALYCFFALATSGFFTVAHRIGALEIATEISRERGRYRRDLHDRLGQALCGLHFEVQAVHGVGRDDQAPARMRSLADGYRDARSMLADLFRGGDEPMVGANVATVIGQESRRMAQQTSTRIDLRVSGDAARIPPWMRPHVAAIAGESMHNAVKNGLASGIDIEIDVTDELLVVSVTDDGVGFDNPPGTITEKDGHFGLREMAERARLCSGEVVVASQPGFGTRVRLQAPLPHDAAEDLLERDASRLRENVWALFVFLRTALGLVAITQLVTGPGTSSAVVAGGLLIVMALDIALPAVFSRRLFGLLSRRPRLVVAPCIFYAALLAVSFMVDVTPYFMLYAPLVLLGAGVHGGRRHASRLTAAFTVLVVLIAAGAAMGRGLGTGELQATLVYVTNLVLLGMSATQGAKLLDRLEALQIRVRYQALARLRQGLSTRMRDQLVRGLDELERATRQLAANASIDDEEFSAATARLQHESSELKTRLRDIVHQLADPTPGRTPSHV